MTLAEVARARLPTAFGVFDLHAFNTTTGLVHLALVAGEIDGGQSVLTQVHSECLTGDALGSLRCDCGVQLRAALRVIGGEGRGVLIYSTGHEGRGIGLINKLRAYMEQDLGADTVEANLRLGLPVDGRDYSDAATVLERLGVRSVRLITNNPAKVEGLKDAGIQVESVLPLPTAANGHTLGYLEAKRIRLGHEMPLGEPIPELSSRLLDVSALIGSVRFHVDRPHVVVKYAQSMDGRIATASGDARWISSEEERRMSHALRARCDAIMVGVGTILNEDPRLTVRLVPGPSPVRVILDSRLSAPSTARVFDDAAPTVVLTTDGFDPQRRRQLSERNVAVRVVPRGPQGVDVRAALALLKEMRFSSLLVEGGQRVITSMLQTGCADRVVVALAPIVLGKGIEGVGDLGILDVGHGIQLVDRSVALVGGDVIVAADVQAASPDTATDPLEGNGLSGTVASESRSRPT